MITKKRKCQEAVRVARAILAKYGAKSLLSAPDANSKIVKSNIDGGKGCLSTILHLYPSARACPFADGCFDTCLSDAGLAADLASINIARKARTEFLWEQRAEFMGILRADIESHIRRSVRFGLIPAIRLNGTSDILREIIAPNLFTDYPSVTWYDYTKVPNRKNLPRNYSLTFSFSDSAANQKFALAELRAGRNVAVVMRGFGISRYPKPIPKMIGDFRTINGDADDRSFLDKRGSAKRGGHIVVLRAKGPAIKDTSGFVVDADKANRMFAR